MKHPSIYTAALAALMLILAGCSDEQYDNSLAPGQQPGNGASGPLITVTATQGTTTEPDGAQTRLGYNDPSDHTKPIEVTWAEGDKFYVSKDFSAYSSTNGPIPYNKAFSTFTLTNGAGSKSAEFKGTLPTELKDGDTLYAFYGSLINTIKDNPGLLSFSYTDQQTQTANGDKSHLSEVDFMVATTIYKEGETPIFNFTHLGAMIKFNLTMPKAGMTVKELSLATTNGSAPFSSKTQWDIKGEASAFSNGLDARTAITLYLGEWEDFTLTGKVLTAYMMVPPTSLTDAIMDGETLALQVTDADNVIYTASFTGAKIEQGKYYTVEAAPKKIVEEMRFTIKVDADLNFRIPFPTSGTTPDGIDITVNWGDGSEATTVPGGTSLSADDSFKHNYATASTYIITITSSQTDAAMQQIPHFKLYGKSDAKKLISMDTPMLNTGADDFSHSFEGCTNLTSLPKGLFDNNTKVEDFGSCFYGCTSLTSLPKGLFDNNTKVMYFSSCFYNCTSLTSLPQGLFNNNINVTNFGYCFYGCSNLVLNETIFSAATLEAKKARFSGRSMAFFSCFYNTGSALNDTQNISAPRLWEYETGGTKWSTDDCYTGCKASNLTESFPASGWGTPAAAN